MENAVEALKMAFAVMAFMLALSVSIISFNRVKEVSDIVLYSKDETNYYEYYEDYDGKTGKAAENRIVGLETIIPTLYKYYKENYTVIFRSANYDETTGVFTNINPFELYETPSTYEKNGTFLWGKQIENKQYSTYDLFMYKKYNNYIKETNVESKFFSNVYDSIDTERGNISIFSFDLEEEILRHEPWTGTYEKAKENLDRFLLGGIYERPSDKSKYIDYGDGFIKKCNLEKYRFVETIGEYEYSSSQENNFKDAEDEYGSHINEIVKKKKKRVIIFTKIN